jgi:hypothetical protein
MCTGNTQGINGQEARAGSPGTIILGEPEENTESPGTASASSDDGASIDLPISVTKLQEIPSLIGRYTSSYDDGSAPNEQLEYANMLATALLRHYYPESQGFIVVPGDYSLMGKYGWPVELKESLPKGKDLDPWNLPFHMIPAQNIAGVQVSKLRVQGMCSSTDPF